jgi:DNA-binding MarR family transcriptional regulator
MSDPISTDALVRNVWRLMFDYLMRTGPRRSDILAARGLTPNDSRTLMSLEPGEGVPIGTLAKRWNSDPSNTTGIVDRLEKAGYVERRAATADRRVKLVALTPHGEATRDAIMAEFLVPPPELATLGAGDLAQLERILASLSDSGTNTNI